MHKRPHADRQQGDPDQEESQVEHREHADRPDQEQDVAHPRQDDLSRDPLNLPNIGIEARHDVAKPGSGVEARRECLQVAVERQPHIEEDVRGHPRIPEPAPDVEPESERGDPDKRDHDGSECATVAAENGVVDEPSGEEGNEERRRG